MIVKSVGKYRVESLPRPPPQPLDPVSMISIMVELNTTAVLLSTTVLVVVFYYLKNGHLVCVTPRLEAKGKMLVFYS